MLKRSKWEVFPKDPRNKQSYNRLLLGIQMPEALVQTCIPQKSQEKSSRWLKLDFLFKQSGMHVDDDDDDDDDDDLDNLTSFPEPIGQAHDMFFSRIFWVQIHDFYSYQILCNNCFDFSQML